MTCIKFLVTSASPAGCFHAGQVADVEAAAARELVDSGVAVVVERAAPETAMREPGERAVRPPGRTRGR